MSHKINLATLILFVASLLMFAGCQKEKSDPETEPFNANSAEKSSVQAFSLLEELNTLADQNLTSSNGLKSLDLKSTGCPAITVNLNQVPFVVTLDWGSGCTGADNIHRSGKIELSLTGRMNVVGSTATFKFTNFVTDGMTVSGVHRITYQGLSDNADPLLQWPEYAVLTEAKITFADDTYINYRAVTTRSQVAGTNTPLILADDIWQVEGSATGRTRSAVEWSATVEEPLVKKGNCSYFDSGVMAITPAGGVARTIDFGEGTCDHDATLTIGGQTIPIEL